MRYKRAEKCQRCLGFYSFLNKNRRIVIIKPLTEKFKKPQIPSMKFFYKTPLSISLILALSTNSVYAVCAPNQDKNSCSNQGNSPLFLSKDIANNPYLQKNQTYSENFM